MCTTCCLSIHHQWAFGSFPPLAVVNSTAMTFMYKFCLSSCFQLSVHSSLSLGAGSIFREQKEGTSLPGVLILGSIDRIQRIFELGCEKKKKKASLWSLTYNCNVAFSSVMTLGNTAMVLAVPVTQSPMEVTDVFIAHSCRRYLGISLRSS